MAPHSTFAPPLFLFSPATESDAFNSSKAVCLSPLFGTHLPLLPCLRRRRPPPRRRGWATSPRRRPGATTGRRPRRPLGRSLPRRPATAPGPGRRAEQEDGRFGRRRRPRRCCPRRGGNPRWRGSSWCCRRRRCLRGNCSRCGKGNRCTVVDMSRNMVIISIASHASSGGSIIQRLKK